MRLSMLSHRAPRERAVDASIRLVSGNGERNLNCDRGPYIVIYCGRENHRRLQFQKLCGVWRDSSFVVTWHAQLELAYVCHQPSAVVLSAVAQPTCRVFAAGGPQGSGHLRFRYFLQRLQHQPRQIVTVAFQRLSSFTPVALISSRALMTNRLREWVSFVKEPLAITTISVQSVLYITRDTTVRP